MLHGPLRPRIKGSYTQAALRGGFWPGRTDSLWTLKSGTQKLLPFDACEHTQPQLNSSFKVLGLPYQIVVLNMGKKGCLLFLWPQKWNFFVDRYTKHYWPQPTLFNIQDFKSDAVCSLKKDHKPYSKHWCAIRIQSHPDKDLVQRPLPTKGTVQF